MRIRSGWNVNKLTEYTGLGLKLAGDGRMRPAVEVRPAVMPRRKFGPEEMKILMANHGKGLKMSGSGTCEACKGSGMNDKFLFADIAL